jgi:hypothetical protein
MTSKCEAMQTSSLLYLALVGYGTLCDNHIVHERYGAMSHMHPASHT